MGYALAVAGFACPLLQHLRVVSSRMSACRAIGSVWSLYNLMQVLDSQEAVACVRGHWPLKQISQFARQVL